MKKLFVIITLFLLNISIASSQELILKLKSPSNKITIGETLEFNLIITPTDVDTITDSFQIESYPSFFMIVRFTAKKEGEFIIGPYEYEFEGKLLKSDTLKVIVEKPNPDEPNIQIIIPEKVKKKEEIVIKFISTSNQILDIELKDSSLFSDYKTESSFSVSIFHGETKNESQLMLIFKIKKKGTYIITRDWFVNLPDYIIFEERELIVK